MSVAAVAPEAARLLPAAPADWELIAADGLGPFMTRAAYRRPDGTEIEWTSRFSSVSTTPDAYESIQVFGSTSCGTIRRRQISSALRFFRAIWLWRGRVGGFQNDLNTKWRAGSACSVNHKLQRANRWLLQQI